MKLLMITIMPPQPRCWGAMPVLLHGQLAALRKRHDVTLVTLAGPAEDELFAVADLRRSGLEVHAVPLSASARERSWLGRGRMATSWLLGGATKRAIWYHEPELQRTLDDVIAGQRFDLIQAEDVAAGAYRLPSSIPRILTDHEVRRARPFDWMAWRQRPAIMSLVNELDWQRWPRLQASVWRRFDLVQVFSERDADSIARIAPDVAPRVRVNPFCLEVPPPASRDREQPGTLLYVGSFLHPPNVDAAIWLVEEIMPALRARCPGVRLTIVGADPRGLVQHLERNDVRLVGFVPDLTPFYEESAVVLAPMRIGGGQRMKVLHAMAAGKAVVTTSRGAEGLVAPASSAAVSIADEASDVVEATASLLESPSMRHSLGRRARDLVEEAYSPHAYARRAEAIYEELHLRAA